MKTAFIFLFLLVLVASCTSKGQVDENPAKSTSDKQKEDSLWRSYLSSNEETVEAVSAVTVRKKREDITVKFNDHTLSFEYIELQNFMPDGHLEAEGNTAKFELMPGADWMEGKTFQMTDGWEVQQIWTRTETHVSFNSKRAIEVPFCVLDAWKHIQTDWELIEFEKGKPKLNIYYQSEEFPDIEYTVKEFKEAVLSDCGEDWFNEIKDIESIKSIKPSYFLSNYQYKIVIVNPESGVKKELFFIFNTPTTC
ncbi:MAG: Na+-transporting methylmalonyl-CoA/oxaloacetate decarboxylase gamma subunit [Crocinitomicaceae bacterium]|jgi:Na+-transporting methylmalonyl-CoA/oxaloacetate decarboxylase gamma subunit